MDQPAQLPEPTTDEVQALRRRVSPHVWARRVSAALERAAIVSEIVTRHRSGMPMKRAMREVAPEIPRATLQYWVKRAGGDLAVAWERLVDGRVPPLPKRIPERVRDAAVGLRLADGAIDVDKARALLREQYPADGDISESSLLRIWKSAGLAPKVKVPRVQEDVEHYHGGAGLALLAAANAETGAADALARAAQSEARHTVERVAQLGQKPVPEPEGRDEKGRLTAAYNHAARADVEPGEPDARWAPDYQKRQERDLANLQVLQQSPHTWAMKLLTIGVLPLVTGLRGMDGADGPCGEFIGVLGGWAYKSQTLDKFLAQMAFLDVEDALWYAHAATAKELAQRWASVAGVPGWLALVVYVDGTQEPHWTHKYALAGKVSRTGRVAPCLFRISVTAGPGVPLLIETYAGTVSLKQELPRVLERVDFAVGDGELGRITVIDAEMATGKLMMGLIATGKVFVTVLKGPNVARDFQPTSDWQRYRERDELRDGTIVIHGEGVPKVGLRIRVVQMRRGGRHPHSTYFGTNAAVDPDDVKDFLATHQVADVYLSRWPHQEHLFRNARNGLGLDNTHGYGGELVQHVSIETKQEQAVRRVERAKERVKTATEAVPAVQIAEKKATEDEAANAAKLTKLVKAELRAANKSLETAEQELVDLQSTPREIFQRDTTRENIVTAATMNALLLIEYVLREYFGSVRMELRTFIEHFVHTPVTIVTTATEIRYRIQLSPRNPQRAEQMRKACEEATRRAIKRDGRLMVFEAIPP